MPCSYRCDDDCSDSSSVSRISSSSSLVALPHEPSRATIVTPASPSTSQRLAVLLPSNLWKSDADAAECDTLKCTTKFSMFERRHHCRKCGGVFCSTCSAKTTDLLDTSSMPFIIPPSSMPLYLLAASAPPGALVNARVCDDCYNTIHGSRSSTRARSPLATESCIVAASSSQPKPTSTASTSSALLPAFSPSSLSSSSSASLLASPVDAPIPPSTRSTGSRHRSRRPLSRSNSSTTVPQSPTVRRTSIHSTDSNRGTSVVDNNTPKDLGVLDSYPLKISSQGCKLTGAAVWSPRHIPHKYDAPHVVVAASLPTDEDDEHDNHCIRVNGEFQVRAPVQDPVISTGPEWSTF
ncbi:hypothetical protein FRC03_006524 [Tulasnella sp. 419]|nr:hypothetical protein FRC03_006524 [Tulasnella sp. 419]